MENTKLLIEGVSPEEITVSFLTGVMEKGEEEGLSVDGISILWDNPKE